jgi:hypothetical protein
MAELSVLLLLLTTLAAILCRTSGIVLHRIFMVLADRTSGIIMRRTSGTRCTNVGAPNYRHTVWLYEMIICVVRTYLPTYLPNYLPICLLTYLHYLPS